MSLIIDQFLYKITSVVIIGLSVLVITLINSSSNVQVLMLGIDLD